SAQPALEWHQVHRHADRFFSEPARGWHFCNATDALADDARALERGAGRDGLRRRAWLHAKAAGWIASVEQQCAPSNSTVTPPGRSARVAVADCAAYASGVDDISRSGKLIKIASRASSLAGLTRWCVKPAANARRRSSC